MPQQSQFDVLVIGSGPAGYVGAIRAAQLGLSVACVERDKLGGVCLNHGCIPTKALLTAAQMYHQLKDDAAAFGILADNVSYDWAKVIGRSRTVSTTLNKGIGSLLKKNKITHIQGQAKIIAPAGQEGQTPAQVHITDIAGQLTDQISAKHILIATGAKARPLPIDNGQFDDQRVISAKEAMLLESQPKKLLIIGAGAIGMEFAYFYHAFGTEVVLVEMLDHLLPNEDVEVSQAIEKAWRKLKIQTHLKTKTVAIEKSDQGVQLTVASVNDSGQTQTITGDKVLLAVGVQGNYEGLFDDGLGLELYKGHIKVNKTTYQTNLPGIYAVGDVIGPPWLAHVASEEAVTCVERIASHPAAGVDYDAIPGCTYCHPQVASIGLTEQACKDQNLDYQVGKFPFQASGKAQAMGTTQGFVKIIADKNLGEILGVHMIGENVTELIAQIGLAKRMEATYEELIATMHAHPTLSEAVHEAALGIAGRSIHF